MELAAGNRRSEAVKTTDKGIEKKEYSSLPDAGSEPYRRAANILKRLGDIANKVSTDATLSSTERAKYDAEFQSLKQQLKDNGFGKTPTAAAAANPKAAKLENLELLSASTNLLTAASASSAATAVTGGQNKLFLQLNGKSDAEAAQTTVARDAYYAEQRFDIASAIARPNPSLTPTEDSNARLIARYSARTDQAFNKATIYNLLS